MTIRIGPYSFDRVHHDRDADVLYLSIGEPAQAINFGETSRGHAVGFDEHGDLVSLTLIDIRELLEEAEDELHLELPTKANVADLELALA